MKIENNTLTKEQIEMVEEINIDIDMLIGFLIKGNLAATSLQRIVPLHVEILEEGENSPYTINVFGHDYHPKNCIEFTVFNPHAEIGNEEAEMIPELKRFLPTGIEFKKNNNNLIFAPGFIQFILSFPNLKRVKVMGVLSEYCVKLFIIALKNLFNEYNRNIDVYVVENAIDTFDAPGHDANEINRESINEMKNNGIKVLKKTIRKEGNIC